MNFKNSLLGGIVMGGGVWFIWVIFLLGKIAYGNWFFMSLKPDLEVGLFNYNQWSLVLLVLGILVCLGALGGILGYFIRDFRFVQKNKKTARKEREKIKRAVSKK